MYDELKMKIKRLFIIRAILWVIAAGATVFWIYWSFRVYVMGISDVHDYATIMRPILYGGLITSAVCIIISFRLRHISDGYKKQIKDHDMLVKDTTDLT